MIDWLTVDLEVIVECSSVGTTLRVQFSANVTVYRILYMCVNNTRADIASMISVYIIVLNEQYTLSEQSAMHHTITWVHFFRTVLPG